MKMMLMLGFGLVCAASGALAQTPDPAAWRPLGPGIGDAPFSLPQFIQQDLGRGGFAPDRGPRSGRMNRDDDDDDSGQGGDGGRMGGPLVWRHGGRPSMMASGGARFHMRKGDAGIDVSCPSDVRLAECVDAIGRVLDRLGAMGAGSGGPAPGPR